MIKYGPPPTKLSGFAHEKVTPCLVCIYHVLCFENSIDPEQLNNFEKLKGHIALGLSVRPLQTNLR